jgi:hypothetical protein
MGTGLEPARIAAAKARKPRGSSHPNQDGGRFLPAEDDFVEFVFTKGPLSQLTISGV